MLGLGEHSGIGSTVPHPTQNKTAIDRSVFMFSPLSADNNFGRVSGRLACTLDQARLYHHFDAIGAAVFGKLFNKAG